MLEFDLSPEEADVFLQEAEELLLQLNEGLVQLESAGDAPELVQQIFRAAHTLKGSGGVIGHKRMAEVLHSMETLMDRVRHGQMAVTPELIDVLLQGADAVRLLVGEVSSREDCGLDTAPLLAELKSLVDGAASRPEAAKEKPPLEPGPELAAEVEAALAGGQRLLEVRAEVDASSIAPGARILQVLLAVQECGRLLASEPKLEDLNDEWDGRAVQALLLADEAAPLQSLLGSISEVTYQVIPRQVGQAGPQPDNSVPTAPAAGSDDGLAASGGGTPESAAQPESPKAQAGGSGSPRSAEAGRGRADANQVRWVRTSVERLDALMNLVSELVTDRNRLMQVRANLTQRYGEENGLGELSEALAHFSSITDQLQDEVMRARMVPIENTFSKFPRVVRDLARQLNKQINLVIEGQETELDRTVIEEIGDPLMHLVRNCVDHGIEAPEERLRAGKPERGTLRLAARSEENHIIILVEDDGAGIDPERMRETAVRKGLLDADAARQLSDAEAIELIFRPGFSTAKVVSGVSGRGVGMDVVRTNIERLNGSVSVHTKVGEGTRFELKLPLTLAIFPALMVEVFDSVYAIPLSAVEEAMHIRAEDIRTVRGRETIISRGKVLPILCLDEFFAYAGAERGATRYVVEVRWGETTVGLAVHRLLGRQEVVIKPLGRMIGEVPGISGGTIMGDGRVALIMDVPSLVKVARQERRSA